MEVKSTDLVKMVFAQLSRVQCGKGASALRILFHFSRQFACFVRRNSGPQW